MRVRDRMPLRWPKLPVVPRYAHAPEDPAFAAERAATAERLRRVCADMAPDQFELLVRDVAAFRVRWSLR
jgi:hypothetical protein